MNYFEFYQIEEAFYLDEVALRQKYYEIMRSLHPDFFAQASENEQSAALERSTFNNQAYKTLSQWDSRMEYILNLHQKLDNAKLPQSFLMEMMELNETAEDAQTEEEKLQLRATLKAQETIWLQAIEPILKRYTHSTEREKDLEAIQQFYLQCKYLRRLMP